MHYSRISSSIPLTPRTTGSDTPLLLLVDGLDEALRQETGTKIPALLGSFLGELQAMGRRVRLVLSSREVPGVLRYFGSRVRRLQLGDEPAANEADLRAFLTSRLTRPPADRRLRKAETSAEAVIGWLAGKAEGNFQYAEQALLGIEEGALDPSDPSAFPDGLVGLYQAYFDRSFLPPREWRTGNYTGRPRALRERDAASSGRNCRRAGAALAGRRCGGDRGRGAGRVGRTRPSRPRPHRKEAHDARRRAVPEAGRAVRALSRLDNGVARGRDRQCS